MARHSLARTRLHIYISDKRAQFASRVFSLAAMVYIYEKARNPYFVIKALNACTEREAIILEGDGINCRKGSSQRPTAAAAALLLFFIFVYTFGVMESDSHKQEIVFCNLVKRLTEICATFKGNNGVSGAETRNCAKCDAPLIFRPGGMIIAEACVFLVNIASGRINSRAAQTNQGRRGHWPPIKLTPAAALSANKEDGRSRPRLIKLCLAGV